MKCCACIIPGVPLPFISRGWGNGYVLIPQGHPLYGKFDFYAPEFEGLEVHGGITYSDKNIPIKNAEFITDEPDFDYWVLGFDTAHCLDNPSLDKEWVKQETLRFKTQSEAM